MILLYLKVMDYVYSNLRLFFTHKILQLFRNKILQIVLLKIIPKIFFIIK